MEALFARFIKTAHVVESKCPRFEQHLTGKRVVEREPKAARIRQVFDQ